jgi:vancomycin permeability regulator SanA
MVFVVTATAISVDGLHDRIGKADVGVVLGTKVERNGTPSLAMARRLDEAVKLYRQGDFATVIVSGGQGREGYDEASVMRTYLLGHNIPAAAIIADHHGNNTEATARNTTAWMRAHGYSRVLLMSQFYHLPRSRLAFERCGMPAQYASHARLFSWHDAYAVSREVVGYYAYLAFDRGCAHVSPRPPRARGAGGKVRVGRPGAKRPGAATLFGVVMVPIAVVAVVVAHA